MFGRHPRRPVVVHTQFVATQIPPLLRVVAWPPTLDRRSTWHDDRDRRQDAVQPHLTSFFLLRSPNPCRPPARPTDRPPTSLQACKRARELIVLGCMHASSMDVIIRQHCSSESIRGTGTPVCARLTRFARPGQRGWSRRRRPNNMRARKKANPACQPAQARTASRSLALCYGQRNRLFLLALHGRVRLTYAWVLPRTWKSYGMR